MFAYIEEGGTTAVCSKQSSIPDGATWLETASVPDLIFRNAWRIVNASLVTDLPLAKEIVNAKRREQRALAFVPHDDIIMKQIPNADATAAETARASIREADALVQIAITGCVDEEALVTLYHAQNYE